MKNANKLVTVLTSTALLALPPLALGAEHESAKMADDQATAKEVRREVIDAADAIKDYTADKRDEAAAKAEAALDTIDTRIDAMQTRIEKRWDKMDQAAREQARESMRALQRERVEVAEWYGGLKNSSEAAWEHMKAGFSKAYRALRTGWEKAEQEYAEESKR